MKRRLLGVYVATVVLAFLVLTGSILWRVGSLRGERYQEAVESFQVLSRNTAELWRTTETVEDAARRMRVLLRDSTRLQPVMYSVSTVEHRFDYVWAAENRFFPSAHDQRTYTAFPEPTDSLRQARFVRSFEVSRGDQRTITALYPILPQHTLFRILRDGLVASLVILAGTAAVAIANMVPSRKTTGGSLQAAVPETPRERTPQAEHLSEDSALEMPLHADRERSVQEQSDQEQSDQAQSDPRPTPILNPEKDVLERLTAELERAGFSEQDLSVALFDFNQGAPGDKAHRENAEAIKTFFVFKDLCFELGDTAAVVLIPNATLPEALSLIERFQRYYWEQRPIWSRPEADFNCGVSARAARLVDAERIMSESRAALRRSYDNPGRILGFNPDPQKYRDYLSAS